MNSRNLEQARIFKRYLMKRADRSRSRLVRDQIRRWVERLDAARFSSRDHGHEARESVLPLEAT